MKLVKWFLPFLMVACITPGRVTTPEERATAEATLSLIESAVVVAAIKGKISPEDSQLASNQINEFRALVTSSATHAVNWSDVYHRIMNMAIQWAVHKEESSASDGGGSPPVDGSQ